jgi:hypothetical protein
MSIYNLDSDKEDLDIPSHRSPTIIIHDVPLPMHMEEVHSSPIKKKILPEMHSVIQEEDHPSNYSIEEIFDAFTFNLCWKEVSQKRVQSAKHDDGTMKEVQEYEVMFEKTDEDPVTIAPTSTTLTQAIAHNITMLNENLLQTKS